MTLQVGSQIYNRYRIDEVIAQGGMGAIYRAYDESLGVKVALKENLFGTEESTRQFRREATILAGLRHPNLPRVTDHFTLPNQGQYLVMDFIEGEDLRQRMARLGPISEDDAVAIGAAICDALQYLHTRQPPVVHRDIKPGNVKISPNGQVYLVDFGLAKVAAPGQATTTGAQALTPGYAPPEQYGQGTTTQSDLYALGATLYAGLTSKIPEDGLARAMGTTVLTPLRRYAPHISERTAMVIEKAMAVRPEDRYRTAEEMRLALLNTPPGIHASSARPAPSVQGPSSAATVRSSTPLNVQPRNTQQFPTVETPQFSPPPAYPPAGPQSAPISAPIPAPARRFPVWALLGGLALIAMAAIGYLLLNGKLGLAAPARSSETPTLQVILPTSTVQPTQAKTTFTAVPTTAVPVIVATFTTGPTHTNPPPTLTFTPPATATPAATPLGGGKGQIAFASIRDNKRPQIWIANSNGSNARQITDISDGACQPSWAPDGSKLVFTTPCLKQQEEYPGGTLFIINADGSNPEPLPSMPGGDFDPAWSPDGKQIAFTSLREGMAHIFVMTLADFKVERLTGAFSDDRRPAWSPDGSRIAFESTRLGQRQVWLMGSKGENQGEFTRLAEGLAYQAAWSVDGKTLFYNRDIGLPSIYARRTDMTLPPESRLTDQRPVNRPRISKDGQWIAFESWGGANHDIYIMRISGTNRQAVTNDANFDFDPVWRP